MPDSAEEAGRFSLFAFRFSLFAFRFSLLAFGWGVSELELLYPVAVMVERRFSAASSIAFYTEQGFNPAALRLGYGVHQAWKCSC